ncbi:MAG: hypothetical protein FWG90_03595 [Oscillospiraceae bacterium]|nr:hypothetical protein [Oscillospiraceae bacterium]
MAKSKKIYSEHNPKNHKYADFVYMTIEESEKLERQYGVYATEKAIEILNNHKGAHGQRYVSDYMAIKKWVVESDSFLNWCVSNETHAPWELM